MATNPYRYGMGSALVPTTYPPQGYSAQGYPAQGSALVPTTYPPQGSPATPVLPTLAGPLQIEPVTNPPATNPPAPILPTLPIRPRISGEGDGGLFGQETPGGIGTLNPGALGWSSFKDFMPTRNVDYVGPRLSSQQIADAYAASIPQSKPVFSGILDRPLGKTFENWVSGTGPLGMMLSGASGIPFWGYALDAIGDYTRRKQAGHWAMEQQGIPGYSSGTIGGNPFTISPGLFGRGITGNVPQGFTVTMAENMKEVAASIDPNTGLPLVSGTGQGGYNEAGDWVDAYGNVSAYGLMQDAQALADKHGISLGNVRAALANARSMPGTTVDEYGNVMGGGLGMSIQARQSRAPEAAILGRDYADEGGYAWESEDWSEEDEGDMPEDDPTEDDYYSFNTGGPVIKRRGFRETATSPLAAGSFVDKPLYDRAVDTSPTYRRW